jgi:hypothetical protein
MYPSSLLRSLFCGWVLSAADYGLTQVQNRWNETFNLEHKLLSKQVEINLLSEQIHA